MTYFSTEEFIQERDVSGRFALRVFGAMYTAWCPSGFAWDFLSATIDWASMYYKPNHIWFYKLTDSDHLLLYKEKNWIIDILGIWTIFGPKYLQDPIFTGIWFSHCVVWTL